MSNSRDGANNIDWNDQKVVVTGGCGMIGTPLVRLLLEANAHVTVLDDLSHGRTRIEGATYRYSDAGNEGVCRDVFKDTFAVFNLAAEVAGILYNQSHHFSMFTRNLRLLTTPVRIASEYRVSHFLQTSSVCVYDPAYNHPCIEFAGLLGYPDPSNEGYAWAKRMGEYAIRWSNLSHAVIVRPTNAYGPLDYFDARAHVIPALIRKCFDDDAIHVNGSGNEIRELIYSEDVAQGMIAALERGGNKSAYNLGTHGQTCITIRDLVAIIRRLTDTGHKPIVLHPGNSGGDPKRWSDCSLAQRDLNWQSQVTLEEGLAHAIKWYIAEREKA